MKGMKQQTILEFGFILCKNFLSFFQSFGMVTTNDDSKKVQNANSNSDSNGYARIINDFGLQFGLFDYHSDDDLATKNSA